MITFWECVNKTDGCWEWARGLGSHGYGQFYAERGKPLLAHRHSWELANGPITDGLHVLHRCDNKLCVRPDHLFLGTQRDNMKDMCAKGRHARTGPRGECAVGSKLTERAVLDIRARLLVGTRQAPGNAVELAAEHGVSRRLIYLIGKRKAWRHVA